MRVIRFGRDPVNDRIIDDLRVDPRHAELHISGSGQAEVIDLGSRIGVLVDGRRVKGRQAVGPGQVLTIGSYSFALNPSSSTTVAPVRAGQAVELLADQVGVVAGRTEILKSLTIRLQPGNVLAVLGPSGSGKSTVIKALAGANPPARGTVAVDGEDVYSEDSVVQHLIGYVPQDDILHTSLTVRSAMRYAAELRFPPTVSGADRARRIEDVLHRLGLDGHLSTKVENLSGGQRKRVNVAIELLTAPSMIFLDEPTSGLDPFLEHEVMQHLRRLADEGRTIVVVTRHLQSLPVCDVVLFMARGGQQAYFGELDGARRYFGQQDLVGVFSELDSETRDWQNDWERHTQSSAVSPSGGGPPKSPTASRRQPKRSVPPLQPPFRQFRTLTRRYVEVLFNDGRQSLLALAQGPLIGLLMLAVMGSGHLSESLTGEPTKAAQVLLALVIGSIYVGASNSVREVVKEGSILRRERAAGLSFAPYIGSKAVVLGALTAVQSLILVVLGAARQEGPPRANLLEDGRLELFAAVAMTGIASMALGLLISTLVAKEDKAMLVLPIMLFAQFVLSGVSFSIDQPLLTQLSWTMPARWGFAAVASTSDVPVLTGGCPTVGGCPALWEPGADRWLASMLALSVLTVGYLGLAVGNLNRRARRHVL